MPSLHPHLLAALLLVGCTEYQVQPKEEVPDDGQDTDTVAPGQAQVGPSALELGVVCTQGTDLVRVENVGQGPLEVTGVQADGEGWSAAHDSLPVTLEPGEILNIAVTGGPGQGTLTVDTDDPVNPRHEVPLRADADQPPTAQITSPGDSDVLDVSSVTAFLAQVSDDVDSADALTLSWSSDVDGVLSSDPATASGEARFDWDASQRSEGIHTVTLTATDSCGQSVNAVIPICQNAGYLAENLDLSTWHFEGDALWDTTNRWVQLTNTNGYQAGTAFQTGAAVDSGNVSIAFSFFVSGGTGADGMSVTALDTNRMTSFVGSSGGGIGYGGLPGWSIEVDTWHNTEYYDPTPDDHLSLHIDGNLSAPITWATLPEMEDGNWHQMEVNVSGSHMTVSVDGVTYIDDRFSQLTSFPAYVGFTAATGGSTNFHLVDALQVEEFVCEEG